MRFLLRLIGRLGLRWMAFGALARYGARWLGRSQVDRAIEDLEAKAQDRLPAPLARAVASLPADAKRAGGSAVVAGRTAKNAAVMSKRASRVATSGTRRAASGLDSFRGLADRVRDETDSSRRELKARYLEATEGRAAATDSLLDARSSMVDGLAGDGAQAADEDPHRSVPDPIVSGRARALRRRPTVVGRMRRGYRPAPKPWD